MKNIIIVTLTLLCLISCDKNLNEETFEIGFDQNLLNSWSYITDTTIERYIFKPNGTGIKMYVNRDGNSYFVNDIKWEYGQIEDIVYVHNIWNCGEITFDDSFYVNDGYLLKKLFGKMFTQDNYTGTIEPNPVDSKHNKYNGYGYVPVYGGIYLYNSSLRKGDTLRMEAVVLEDGYGAYQAHYTWKINGIVPQYGKQTCLDPDEDPYFEYILENDCDSVEIKLEAVFDMSIESSDHHFKLSTSTSSTINNR